jgi:hypothetical protein
MRAVAAWGVIGLFGLFGLPAATWATPPAEQTQPEIVAP